MVEETTVEYIEKVTDRVASFYNQDLYLDNVAGRDDLFRIRQQHSDSTVSDIGPAGSLEEIEYLLRGMEEGHFLNKED